MKSPLKWLADQFYNEYKGKCQNSTSFKREKRLYLRHCNSDRGLDDTDVNQ